MAGCATKQIFPNSQMANKAAYFHNRDLFRDDDAVEAYPCARHKGWHIGHQKRYDNPVARVHKILEEKSNGGESF
jgi:hypothetical protein